MNNVVYTSQVIGTLSIFLLFTLQMFIVSNSRAWAKSGRLAVTWTTIYVFFLFILRLFSLYGLASQNDLRVVSGFAALIPLLGVVSHLFLSQQSGDSIEITTSLDEAKKILLETKTLRSQAAETLADAQQKAVTKKVLNRK